jgi:hypothetical protein
MKASSCLPIVFCSLIIYLKVQDVERTEKSNDFATVITPAMYSESCLAGQSKPEQTPKK